jgi:hypothetical protein
MENFPLRAGRVLAIIPAEHDLAEPFWPAPRLSRARVGLQDNSKTASRLVRA